MAANSHECRFIDPIEDRRVAWPQEGCPLCDLPTHLSCMTWQKLALHYYGRLHDVFTGKTKELTQKEEEIQALRRERDKLRRICESQFELIDCMKVLTTCKVAQECEPLVPPSSVVGLWSPERLRAFADYRQKIEEDKAFAIEHRFMSPRFD